MSIDEGFIKFYRKARHSKVWSRGIEYRGLFITLLTYATYKESTFIGQKIQRGQVALSLDNLSQELRIERTKLHRMLKNLEKDGAIIVQNVQHRFTLVSICNYSLFQDSKESMCNADATPVQTLEESKKERNKIHNVISDSENDELEAKPKKDKVPYEKWLTLYHQKLPSLSEVKKLTSQRKAQIKARWADAIARVKLVDHIEEPTEQQILDWWERFFIGVSKSDFLMGRKTAFSVKGIDWLVKEANFVKILEGQYKNK